MRGINNYIVEKLKINKDSKVSHEEWEEVIDYINNWLDSFVNLKNEKDYTVSKYIQGKRIKIYYYFNPHMDENILNKIKSNIKKSLTEMKTDLGYEYFETIRFSAIDKHKSITLENYYL